MRVFRRLLVVSYLVLPGEGPGERDIHGIRWGENEQ